MIKSIRVNMFNWIFCYRGSR